MSAGVQSPNVPGVRPTEPAILQSTCAVHGSRLQFRVSGSGYLDLQNLSSPDTLHQLMHRARYVCDCSSCLDAFEKHPVRLPGT
jgi:hypothetical protein